MHVQFGKTKMERVQLLPVGPHKVLEPRIEDNLTIYPDTPFESELLNKIFGDSGKTSYFRGGAGSLVLKAPASGDRKVAPAWTNVVNPPEEEKPKRNGYIFHGGCSGCKNDDLAVCAGCRFLEKDWDLPDLSIYTETRTKAEMIAAAKEARRKETRWTGI